MNLSKAPKAATLHFSDLIILAQLAATKPFVPSYIYLDSIFLFFFFLRCQQLFVCVNQIAGNGESGREALSSEKLQNFNLLKTFFLCLFTSLKIKYYER